MGNFWDERYAGQEYLFGTKPAQGLIALEPHLVEGGKTLVVADGEGRNSVFLAKLGYDVLATDYSEVAQTKAKALAQKEGATVTFELADIFDLEHSEQQYDNVVAIFIQFVPPAQMARVFASLARATKPGGTLLIHGYTPEQVALGTGGPGNPDHMYTTEMLAQAFSQMQIVVNRAYHAELDEGRGHSGQSALIDFVARAPLE